MRNDAKYSLTLAQSALRPWRTTYRASSFVTARTVSLRTTAPASCMSGWSMLPRKCVPPTSSAVGWSALPSSIAASSRLLAPCIKSVVRVWRRCMPPARSAADDTDARVPAAGLTVRAASPSACSPAIFSGSVLLRGIALHPVQYFGMREVDSRPAQDLDPLAGLEILVMLEEMLNLFQTNVGHVADRLPMNE
jgi:hypothetical protein